MPPHKGVVVAHPLHYATPTRTRIFVSIMLCAAVVFPEAASLASLVWLWIIED